MARIFKEDVTTCKKCKGDLYITAAILERDAIVRILTHLGIPTEIPKFHLPLSRAPPSELDDYKQPQFDEFA